MTRLRILVCLPSVPLFVEYFTIGAATDCGLDDRGSIPDIGTVFYFPLKVQSGSGAQLSSYSTSTEGKEQKPKTNN